MTRRSCSAGSVTGIVPVLKGPLLHLSSKASSATLDGRLPTVPILLPRLTCQLRAKAFAVKASEECGRGDNDHERWQAALQALHGVGFPLRVSKRRMKFAMLPSPLLCRVCPRVELVGSRQTFVRCRHFHDTINPPSISPRPAPQGPPILLRNAWHERASFWQTVTSASQRSRVSRCLRCRGKRVFPTRTPPRRAAPLRGCCSCCRIPSASNSGRGAFHSGRCGSDFKKATCGPRSESHIPFKVADDRSRCCAGFGPHRNAPSTVLLLL